MLNPYREEHGVLLESFAFQGPCSAQHGGLVGDLGAFIFSEKSLGISRDQIYITGRVAYKIQHGTMFRVDWGAGPKQPVKSGVALGVGCR